MLSYTCDFDAPVISFKGKDSWPWLPIVLPDINVFEDIKYIINYYKKT